MRSEYKQIVIYDLVFKDGSIINYETNCFRNFKDYEHGDIYEILLKDIDCQYTIEYKEFYLNYIIKMLKLDASYDDNSFTFKAYNCKNKNLLVCSLVRLLWERLGNNGIYDNVKDLLKPLKEGKSKYRNKLARFCDFYSKIPNKSYFGAGHGPYPWKTKIKYTKDFISKESLESFNSFFEND